LNQIKKQCDSCGTCCRNGGPPLHVQDIELVRTGSLVIDNLVTVRCGELVIPPMATKPVPTQSEWIKIQGVGSDWCCRFFDASSNSCTIYEHRPSSCRALKCWDTDEIMAMAGRDLLARSDLIDNNDPLLKLVYLQEKRCPVPEIENIVITLTDPARRDELLMDLTDLVKVDLQIRTQAVREFNISVARELFYFGRPLFQLFHPLGIMTVETPQGVELKFQTHS
jgi:Fe-S-cluster containining protein